MRITIIGNAGGGKSTLSIRLGAALKLPVYHLDYILFDEHCRPAHANDVMQKLNQWLMLDTWIIEGWGSLRLIEARAAAANVIIFIDFPLAVHGWWALKREFNGMFDPSVYYRGGCSHGTFII